MKVLGYSFHNLCLATWYFTDHCIIGKKTKKLQKISFFALLMFKVKSLDKSNTSFLCTNK